MQPFLTLNNKKPRLSILLASLLIMPLINIPIALAHGDEIEEVVGISSRTGATLDDTPMRMQVLNEEELNEKSKYEAWRHTHDAQRKHWHTGNRTLFSSVIG